MDIVMQGVRVACKESESCIPDNNAWWGSHCIAAALLKGIWYHIWAKMTQQPHAVASATAGVGSAQKDTHHDMETTTSEIDSKVIFMGHEIVILLWPLLV